MGKKHNFINQENNRLMKALLASETTLQDVFRVKEDDGSGKNKKPLVAALKRSYSKAKDDTMIEVCGEEFTYEVLVRLFHRYDNGPRNRHLRVPLRLSLYEIEKGLKLLGMPRWGKLDWEERNKILFSLGMDSSEPNPVYTDRAYYRDEKTNKVEYGLVIIGEERVDKEWRMSGYASKEAILYTEDLELAKDLATMGRQ